MLVVVIYTLFVSKTISFSTAAMDKCHRRSSSLFSDDDKN